MTSEQRFESETLLKQHPDVLTRVPGRTDQIQHNIKLLTSEPMHRKGYPILFKACDVMEAKIKEMLYLGVIGQLSLSIFISGSFSTENWRFGTVLH